MITVICATHRPGNQTAIVVSTYLKLLEEAGEDTCLLKMEELPPDFMVSDTFGNRTALTDQMIAEKLIPAAKLVVISPEYNGSFPGVFKVFIDGIKPGVWRGKKVALVGVASGRAGNLRGMDHLTHVFHHLRAEVFSFKVPISKIDALLDSRHDLVDEDTIGVLRKQIQEFRSF